MSTDVAEPAPRFTAVRRLRVLARRGLFAGLQAVPGRVVLGVHDRWIDGAGRRHGAWRPAATALFYRPVPLPAVTVPGGRERIAVVGSRMERVLWWYGEAGYEDGEAARWRALCAGARDVLELGANIGYYSVVGALAAPGRYTTVEANPEAAAVVRRNLALNGLALVEVVEAAAVADGAPAELDLALPDQETRSVAPMGAYLREGTELVSDRASSRSVRVATTPASALFAGRDLVKLDIEGSEAAVLAAARGEILASRPVILLEVLAGATRLHGVLARLIDDGYRLRSADGTGRPIPLDELRASPARDVLLLPGERADDA